MHTLDFAMSPNVFSNNSNVVSNWNYRQYMQRNASHIMENNSLSSIDTLGVPVSYNTTKNSVVQPPMLFASINDYRTPRNGSRASDLKREYIENQRVKSRMMALSIPTDNF